MQNLLAGLNDKQKEAVLAIEGKVRVVAGAGSGKTRVLAHRYAFLVNEIGVAPANILCMTFTNKAAQEMKNRIGKMVHQGNANDFICTIHGFCVKFLRSEIYRIGYPKNFSIIDEEDSKAIAKQVMEEMKLERTALTIKQLLKSIERFKRQSDESNNTYIDNIILPNANVSAENITPEIRFIQYQLKNYTLDFTDIILFTLHLLHNFEEARTFWQDKINYMLVDEVQDCNSSDWSIINILSDKYKNLFIVGDPDQAIYEWRGARPDVFVNFKADTDIILSENYRSTPNILDVANSIIKNNLKRVPKELFTNRQKNYIAIHYHGKSENEESDWIAIQIKKIHEQGNEYGNIAILYRSSYLSRSIEQALLKKHIKYTVWGGVRFFERKEIKDALSYLRLIAYNDNISFARIINTPSRRFGNTSLKKLQVLAEERETTLFEALVTHKELFGNSNINKFIELIDECRIFKENTSTSDLLDYILKVSGLTKMYRQDGDEERLENIEELMNSIKYYEKVNAEEEDLSLEMYLQDIALYTNADYKQEGSTVKLMTIHQSKGLEFPYVFVCGLTEGIFPSHRSIRDRRKNGEEEERRLMYVAVTRAEKALYLTESEGYNFATQLNKYPSRFLKEINEDLIQVEGQMDTTLWNGTEDIVEQINAEAYEDDENEFKIGDKVNHKYFGTGTILEINENSHICKVAFGEEEHNARFLQPHVLKLKTDEINCTTI